MSTALTNADVMFSGTFPGHVQFLAIYVLAEKHEFTAFLTATGRTVNNTGHFGMEKLEHNNDMHAKTNRCS